MQTPNSAAEWLEAVEAEEARRNLHTFIRVAWPVVEPAVPFMDNWHIGAIAEHLEAVTKGEIRNLLINMPPRCAKSTTVAVMWPMWVWATTPSFRWLFASYALSLAIRDSLKCRRLIESEWYQRHFGHCFQLAPDQNLKSRFENTERGYRYAVSVGSGVTGEGGDAVVVDDPHNAKTASSETIRSSTLEWWDQAISSRLNDPRTGRKVIVMQRLHDQDLAGHVLEKGDYVHLNLPLEYEAAAQCVTAIGWRDPRAADGALLWPERIGPQEVAKLQHDLGTYGYASQYQQRPTPATGEVFKLAWFSKRYKEIPPGLFRILSIDSAFQEGTESDYSVIGAWGASETHFYKLHQWRGRVAFPGLIAAIRDQAAAWQPEAILIENKASGQSAIQVLRAETSLPIIGVDPIGSKRFRADAASPVFEALRVLLPEDAPWVADYIQEMLRFPRGRHDDQVDESTQAVNWLKRRVQTSVAFASTHMNAAPSWLPTIPRQAPPPEDPALAAETYQVLHPEDADPDEARHSQEAALARTLRALLDNRFR